MRGRGVLWTLESKGSRGERLGSGIAPGGHSHGCSRAWLDTLVIRYPAIVIMDALEDCARDLVAFRSVVCQSMRKATYLFTSTSSQMVRRGSLPRGDDTQLLELRRALGSALKLTDSMQNKRVPVNGLPSEILLRVFGFVNFPLPKKSFSHTLVFSHVCKYWRSAVISNPLFWTNISAGPLTQSGFITLQLQRSSPLPLTLSIQLFQSLDCHCKPDPFFDDAYFCPHSNNRDFNRLLEIFTPYRRRVTTLNVRYLRSFGDKYCEDVLQHQFFRDPLPNLERLSWVSRSLDPANEREDPVITSTKIFSDSLPRLRELALVNTWGLISAAGPNLNTFKVRHISRGRHPDTAMAVPEPELRGFLSHHPLLTSISLGDIIPKVDKGVGNPIEMRHLTNVTLTSRLMELDLRPTLRCLCFGAFAPMETLVIRMETMDDGRGFTCLRFNMTWVDKNGHNISCSFSDNGANPLDVWMALCKAGVCDGVTTVEIKRPHFRSVTSQPFIPLFESSLPHLRTIRMAWGKTTAEEADGSKLMDDPPPDVGWAASYLAPILRCRTAIDKPVYLLERLEEDDEDPADSRLNDLIWEQYLYRAYNFQRYLK